MTHRIDSTTLHARARAERDRLIGVLIMRALRRITHALSGRTGTRPLRAGYRLG